MLEYTFNGEWENGTVSLPIFEQLNRFSNLRDGNTGIPLQFYDLRSLSPDPLTEQLATANWLVQEDNQQRVLAALLPYFRDVIFPQWKEHTLPEEYPDAYPLLNDVADLRNLISFGLITIQPGGRNGRTACRYHFSTPLDYEHGISVEMLDDLVVGWGEGYETENDAAYPPDYRHYWPSEFSSWEEQEQLEAKDLNWYEPHPKYSTLREWQRYQNLYLPNRLYRSGEIDQLTKLLKEHPEIYQKSGVDLIKIALEKGGASDDLLIREILECRENIGDQIPSLLLNHDHFDDLLFLLDKGYDINGITNSRNLLRTQLTAWYRNYEDQDKMIAASKRARWLVEHGAKANPDAGSSNGVFYWLDRLENKARADEIKREVTLWLSSNRGEPPLNDKTESSWWRRILGGK